MEEMLKKLEKYPKIHEKLIDVSKLQKAHWYSRK